MFVTGSSIGSLAFGFMYGFIAIMNRQPYRRYFLGLWYYQRKLKIPLKILTYIVGAGIPFAIFFLISTFFVKDNAIGDYILFSCAACFAGFGLVCFVPILAVKWNVITF